METEIVKDMDWETYRACKEMNASTLVYGIKSMRSLRRAITHGSSEETNAMRLGTGIHCLVLEPEEFEDRFVVMPDFENDKNNLRAAKHKSETLEDRRTNSKATSFYKNSVSVFQAKNVGKCILTRQQYDTALMAIESINDHHSASKYIQGYAKEVTLFGSILGVECKGRVDLLGDYIVDVKSTGDASERAFSRVCAGQNYAFKMAFYRELVRQNIGKTLDVKLIAQETSGDFDTVVYDIPESRLDAAYDLVVSVMERYVTARTRDEWHGVDRGIDTLELAIPSWNEDQAVEVLEWS